MSVRNLFLGGRKNTKSIVIKSGKSLLRGAILSQAKTAELPVAGAGNTGDGGVSGLTLKAKALIGTYRLRCYEEAADGGAFTLLGPDGYARGVALVGVAFESDEITFTINDGATDFAVGDTFDLIISGQEDGNGSPLMKIVNSEDTEGAGTPEGVLIEDVDALTANVGSAMHLTGELDREVLNVGGTDLVAAYEAALVSLGITPKTVH